ncbi:MAG: patatin-like phospholipase family protein [Gammaproteobacteria bacterium]
MEKTSSPIKEPIKKRTVSLVLGGGGARGYVHIGIIQYLLQAGYDIRSISGASMGAVVGGIFAAGKLDVYTRWACALEKTDVIRLLDFSFGSKGLFKGERVMNTLKELVGDQNIEDLPISFTAVATDIYREKEVWLNSGSLFDAIRASIAIPTIFTPVEYKGMHLLDGSLINPVPVAPTLNDKTDMTIVVNLGAATETEFPQTPPVIDHKPGKINLAPESHDRIASFIDSLQQRFANKEIETKDTDMGMFEVVGRSIDTLQNAIARFRLAAYSPEVIINIPRDICSFYEFHRAREMIDIGWTQADNHLNNH